MLRALSILAKMPVMDLKKRGTSDSEKNNVVGTHGPIKR